MEFKAMLKSFFVNLFLSLLKIVTGVLGNSKTLVADGMHSFSDLLTDIVALVGSKASNLPPDKKHPWGHGKYEYITSMGIGLMVLVAACFIFYNSLTSSNKIPSLYVLIVIMVSIITKFLFSRYLIRKSKEVNSSILFTSGTESSYDVYSSVLALFFVGAAELGKCIPALKYADLIGGVLIAIFVFRIGIILIYQNLNCLIGEVDYNEEKENEIKQTLMQIKDIIKVKKITLLKYGTYYILTLDILFNKNIKLEKLNDIEKEIKHKLKHLKYIKYVTINAIADEEDQKRSISNETNSNKRHN